MENEHDAPRRLWALPSWLVNRVALAASRITADQLAAVGLTRKDFSVLAALDEFGPASQAAIGRRLALDRSDLHAVIGGLEDHGLIERARDAIDRRRNVVKLTAKGRAALKRLDARVEQAQDELLAPLSSAERQQLVALLARVVEHHADRTA
jgi:DNA-binding MarR family transcriptional regulator